ncbi:hypothetical protein CVT26_004762 [Gymnopilus dilepis]|uniref:Tim44-like domain-containing protein n=1 Tax=Gymnopilus dilepis TaxID=231916 RepID=A0A409XZB5_9AGAR|nr:hypothetical protein CVT26_004762 [Gymnopilus dilepis]
MAVGMSRAYFGRLGLPVISSCPRLRSYATASATLTKKTPVTAKGTRHDAHPPAPSPEKKAATKGPYRKVTSSEMETAQKTFEAQLDMSKEAEQLQKMQEMQRIMSFQHLMPTVDAWGAEVKETMGGKDVMIPRPWDRRAPIQEIWKTLKDNTINMLKNAGALSNLMNSNALPDVYPPLKIRDQIRHIRQYFTTQSVGPNSVLAPVRQLALEIYEELNDAIANRDEKIIRKYTTHQYQRHALELAKKFRPKDSRSRLIWQLHRTVTPVQILSLRVSQGYFGLDEPKTGNRLMVHALIKFDTEQSLEMYSERGTPLHKYDLTAERITDDRKPLESWRVPAVRKRVTEYLVLEKRMWIAGPWQFREQMWPAVEAKEANEQGQKKHE